MRSSISSCVYMRHTHIDMIIKKCQKFRLFWYRLLSIEGRNQLKFYIAGYVIYFINEKEYDIFTQSMEITGQLYQKWWYFLYFWTDMSVSIKSSASALRSNLPKREWFLCLLYNIELENTWELSSTHLQVTWIRHRDLHLLTVDKTTYTSDQRFLCVHNPQLGDWSLQVSCYLLKINNKTQFDYILVFK